MAICFAERQGGQFLIVRANVHLNVLQRWLDEISPSISLLRPTARTISGIASGLQLRPRHKMCFLLLIRGKLYEITRIGGQGRECQWRNAKIPVALSANAFYEPRYFATVLPPRDITITLSPIYISRKRFFSLGPCVTCPR